MTNDRLENLVGALAVALCDRIDEDADRTVPRREPAAAIAIIGRSPGWTIRQLSGDLGLSHAATVRLVDRLVEDQLIVRGRSESDRRAIALSLTAAGRKTYRSILDARRKTLREVLSKLEADERDSLKSIAGKLLGLTATSQTRSRICRFCDVESCGPCPIDEALGGGLGRS